MDIGKKKYYSIKEVSRITGIKSGLLRYWETEFEILKPKKNKFNHRVYTDKDIEIIGNIKKLLYEEGLTVNGAKKRLMTERLSENKNIHSLNHIALLVDIKKELMEILEIIRNNKIDE